MRKRIVTLLLCFALLMNTIPAIGISAGDVIQEKTGYFTDLPDGKILLAPGISASKLENLTIMDAAAMLVTATNATVRVANDNANGLTDSTRPTFERAVGKGLFSSTATTNVNARLSLKGALVLLNKAFKPTDEKENAFSQVESAELKGPVRVRTFLNMVAARMERVGVTTAEELLKAFENDSPRQVKLQMPIPMQMINLDKMLTIGPAQTLIIEHGMLVSRGEIVNNGTIFTRFDAIQVRDNGIITNNGLIDNYGGIHLFDNSKFQNNGILNNNNTVSLIDGETHMINTGIINNNEHSRRNDDVQDGNQIQIYGKLTNTGTVINDAVFEIMNVIINDGKFVNNGKINCADSCDFKGSVPIKGIKVKNIYSPTFKTLSSSNTITVTLKGCDFTAEKINASTVDYFRLIGANSDAVIKSAIITKNVAVITTEKPLKAANDNQIVVFSRYQTQPATGIEAGATRS